MTSLADRGIADVAALAGWEAYEHKGRAGWRYPVFWSSGQRFGVHRWKAADGESPKYLWLPSKPDQARYYLLPGTLEEINQRAGVAFLAGGEPDVLAYHAAGVRNTFCWLDGEGSPPQTLASDLRLMGIDVLYYAPDRDYAGMISAHKILGLLEGSEINVVLWELPGEVGSRNDINTLWLDSECDPKQFAGALFGMPDLDPIVCHLYAQQRSADKQQARDIVDRQWEMWRNDWVKLVIDALGPHDLMEGTTKRWRCPMPGHEDRHPSFTVTERQMRGFPWPMCTCGIQDYKDAWEQIAGALNVQSWQDFKRERAIEVGYQAPSARRQLDQAPNAEPEPEEEKPLWVGMHQAYDALAAELRGERKPEVIPVKFPMTVLHRFGGFAKWAWPCLLVAITGISGGGKTLLARILVVLAGRAGHDAIWWGPEWTPDQYAIQDLQRAEAMSMEQIAEFRVFNGLKAKHPDWEDSRISATYDAAIPNQIAIDRALVALEQLKQGGEMVVIPWWKEIDDVLAIAGAVVDTRRKAGRTVTWFVWDYAQLAIMHGKHDWTWSEQVIAKIKAFCAEKQLVGIVNSQSRKGDADSVRAGNAHLSAGSAQGLSDAQFNLYLTLTPDVGEDGEFLDTAWIAVNKNSMGRKGKVHVPIDYAHLTVLDEVARPKKVNLSRLDGGHYPIHEETRAS